MSDALLRPRGIEDADSGVLLVATVAKPSAGRVDLNVLAGTQPLGRAEWLHAVKVLVGAGLAVWPELSDTVATVVETARAHGGEASP